ncbi:uncharacterized protein BYT42DRAFT_200539 [Radiomyces spectabilis]|uniref:uncharacterized protein n=1 Tax=Radiomyces spectabilis TaxID=64574 RepID=UPI00221F3CD2|nr:uncharacterized protein BYT42DRAFT_200539 [Radiomyces spectabilis]KAI8391587.1 hypothetical protein BYT42DRAFT_200539 [Radiomyces spectabilis]
MTGIISFDILPDTDHLDLFTGDDIIPNETYILRGHVRLTHSRPILVRRITVQLQGVVRSILSNDFKEPPLQDPWKPGQPSSACCFQRFKYWLDHSTLLGYEESMHPLINLQTSIVLQPTSCHAGVSLWPFELRLPNAHQLPPSITLPRHSISYYLTAHISLSSLKDRMMLHCLDLSQALICSSQRKKLRSIRRPIRIYQHVQPSLESLGYAPRMRYRGSREGHVRYEISMPKYACLQDTAYVFVCGFWPLVEEARIAAIDIYLEQIASYYAGFYTGEDDPSPDDNGNIHQNKSFITHVRKYCQSQYHVTESDNQEMLNLSLSLDLPQLCPDINCKKLRISHKLRLLIHFANSEKERKMSLSFPLHIATVPSCAPSAPVIVRTDESYRPNLLEYGTDDSDMEEIHKLPSYHDVLHEGAPPSPFLEGDTRLIYDEWRS